MALEELFNDYKYLKKQADLLHKILKYWDAEIMTFDIPEKWKFGHITVEKVQEFIKSHGESPRHYLASEIAEVVEIIEDF